MAGAAEDTLARLAELTTRESAAAELAAGLRSAAAAELKELERALDARSIALDAREENLRGPEAALARLGAAQGDAVRLNVGGQLFETSRSVLSRAGSQSMLAALFNGRWGDVESPRGIWIEQDPAAFAHVLSYLQFGRLPPEGMRSAVIEARSTKEVN